MAKSPAMFGPPFPDFLSITLNHQTTQEFLVTPDAPLGVFMVPKPGIKTSLEIQSFIYKRDESGAAWWQAGIGWLLFLTGMCSGAWPCPGFPSEPL